MSTKIQINSLEALERLIGGDDAIAIEIRDSIVKEFAKKYLKPIAHEMANELIRENVSACMSSYLEKNYYGHLKGLSVSLRSLIKSAFDEIVFKHVEEERLSVQSYIDQRIKDAVSRTVSGITDDAIEERIRMGVEKRLKEIASKI